MEACVQIMTLYIHTHIYIWNSYSSPSALQLLSGELEQTWQKTHFHPLIFKDKHCSFQKDFNDKPSCFLLERLIKWNLYHAAALVILLKARSPRSSSSRRAGAPLLALLVPALELSSGGMRPYWASVTKGINAFAAKKRNWITIEVAGERTFENIFCF